MTQQRKFSAESEREAVAMLDAPGVTVSQIACELAIGAGMLGRWRRELSQETERAFPGQDRPRDEEVVHLKRELARVTKERDLFTRSGHVLRERITMKYRMIQRCRETFPIQLMCRCLWVLASGCYGWATRAPSPRAQENARLSALIRHVHTEQDGVVGSPRVWEELRYAGERCGHHRVAHQAVRDSSRGNAQPFGMGLHGHCAQHQVGDRHYLPSHRGALVVPLHRAVSVFRRGGGLVNEPSAGPPVSGPGGADGILAAARWHADHSSFGSGGVSLPRRHTNGFRPRIT